MEESTPPARPTGSCWAHSTTTIATIRDLPCVCTQDGTYQQVRSLMATATATATAMAMATATATTVAMEGTQESDREDGAKKERRGLGLRKIILRAKQRSLQTGAINGPLSGKRREIQMVVSVCFLVSSGLLHDVRLSHHQRIMVVMYRRGLFSSSSCCTA